jgi:hypothetical protein
MAAVPAPKLISFAAGAAAMIVVAAAGCRAGLAANPYPTAPDTSAIQFAFASDAPLGTLMVTIGPQDLEAWEQPAYPGGHLTFTLDPGRYPIEFSGDPVLHFIEARPQAITVVTIGPSADGTGYRLVQERQVAPEKLRGAEQGAAPLRELGSGFTFKIRAGGAR